MLKNSIFSLTKIDFGFRAFQIIEQDESHQLLTYGNALPVEVAEVLAASQKGNYKELYKTDLDFLEITLSLYIFHENKLGMLYF